MSEKRVKQWRRQVRKQSRRIVHTALDKTVQEPLPKRLRVAHYIVRGDAPMPVVVWTWLTSVLAACIVLVLLATLLAPYVDPQASLLENVRMLLGIS